MTAAAEKAGDLVGDGGRSADFAGEFAVGIGFDGDGNLDSFDHAHFFENEDVGVVFVGVFFDVVPRDVDGGELAVEEIFDAFNEVGFIVENAAGLFHESAASFLQIEDIGAEINKFGDGAESIGGDRGGSETESVGKDAGGEVFGGGRVDF